MCVYAWILQAYSSFLEPSYLDMGKWSFSLNFNYVIINERIKISLCEPCVCLVFEIVFALCECVCMCLHV